VGGASDELDAYVTGTGKPKRGGAYDAAIQELESLDAEVNDLSGRVASLRDDLDRRARARKRLAELQDADDLTRNAKALDEANAALKQGEAQAGELEKAVLSENLARQESKTAEEALQRFEAAQTAVVDLKKRVADEEVERDEIVALHTKAKRAEEEATIAVKECRTTLHQSEADLIAAIAAVDALEAARRLEARQKTFADADGAHRAAETARAKARALDLPAARVQSLEKIEDRIATLTAEIRVSSLSVRADYLNPASGQIRANGSTLTDGTDVSVERATRFEIEGIGTLTVSPGTGDRTRDLDQELGDMTERRAGVLAELGVASLAVAHAQQVEVAEHVREAERNEARRDALAPDGLDALRTEIEVHGAAR